MVVIIDFIISSGRLIFIPFTRDEVSCLLNLAKQGTRTPFLTRKKQGAQLKLVAADTQALALSPPSRTMRSAP